MIRRPPTIDMLPDGSFHTQPRWVLVPFSTKLMLGAALVAVLAVSIAAAALPIWVVSLVLPVIVIAGVVAWAMYRYQRWQSRRGQRDVVPRHPGRFGQ